MGATEKARELTKATENGSRKVGEEIGGSTSY